jgi:hypothetical protein
MSDAAAIETTAQAPLPSRWRRRLRKAALAILLLCLAGGAYVFYFFKSAESQLQKTIAEIDRQDPGWRLEELEAHRQVVPPEQNSALLVRAVLALRTTPWPAQQDQFEEMLRDLIPTVRLHQRDAIALRAELKKSQQALAEAWKLADLPTGRFPIVYSSDGISTLSPDVQETREVAWLLHCDLLLQCEDGDVDRAVAGCRAILNTGRSLNDEPLIISQLVRLICRDLALRSLERTLAQGQPSETALAVLQDLLRDEDKQPIFLIMARGERAFGDRLLYSVQTRKTKPSQLGVDFIKRLSGMRIRNVHVNDLLFQLFGSVSKDRAALLDYLSQVVEVAKLPIEEQGPQLAQLESALVTQPEMVRNLVPGVTKLAGGVRRRQAQLRSAIASVALERYRQAHGGWPDSLAALVPKYLASVPADPYDGAPLRFRRLGDHVVVYSPGPDGQDDGGNIEKNSGAAGTDIGFRLWDVKHRRQPPGTSVRPPTPAAKSASR